MVNYYSTKKAIRIALLKSIARTMVVFLIMAIFSFALVHFILVEIERDSYAEINAKYQQIDAEVRARDKFFE